MHLYDNTPHPSTLQKIAEPIVGIISIAMILFLIHMLFVYILPYGFNLFSQYANW